jgi:hypothetical protein
LNYYAARPLPRLSNGLSVGFLLGLLAGLPGAGYVGYHAMRGLQDVPLLAGHRLGAGVGAVVFLIGDLGFLRYVVLRLRQVQAEREAVTAGLAGDAAAMTVCRRCGPFPTGELVVVPSSARKTWTMRAFSVVLLGAVVAFMALLWSDQVHVAVGSAPLVVCAVVGINLWRYSREPAERCPRCGSRKIVAGDTPVGRQLFQEWQLKHQACGERVKPVGLEQSFCDTQKAARSRGERSLGGWLSERRWDIVCKSSLFHLIYIKHHGTAHV